jgi:hypothetical protein
MSVRRRSLLALPALLSACAMPVRERPLAGGVPEVTALQWRNFVDPQLRGQIRLGKLEGSDPEASGFLQQALERVWHSRAPAKPVKDAIEDQLEQLRLLASLSEQARYVLDVSILTLDGGALALSSEGEAELHWQLKEAGSGRLLFDRRLRSSGEVGYGLAWPPARRRAAKESALRANLVKLAEALVRLRV